MKVGETHGHAWNVADPELLHAVLDGAEIGIVLFDGGGRVAAWNHWMVHAADITAAEAIGHTLSELFPDLDGTRIEVAVDECLRLGITALLSSTLHKRLLPLWRHDAAGKREPMKQVVAIKPIADAGAERFCLLQVTDTTAAFTREEVLRQQARTMEALAENYRLSELHIRAIVDNTADAIVTFDEKGAIGTYNPAAERMFGYTPPEIVNKNVGILVPALRGADGVAAAAETFVGERREAAGIRRGGVDFPLELSVSEMELGGQRLFIGIAHDITERKRAEAELKNQKEWLSTLINAMPDMVCFKDSEGRFLVANDFYLDLFGLRGHNYLGLRPSEVAFASDLFASVLGEVDKTDELAWNTARSISYESTVGLRGGSALIFDIVKIPLFDGDGGRKGLVVVGRDVTERKRAAERIQHLAHHDSLTGLPNRALFQERLRQALVQARRTGNLLGVMFLDLDKFKDVNDTLGHHIGDLLLQEVAGRLQGCVRESDTVARLGGDEFALLLTNLADIDGASTVADSIIRVISEPFALDGSDIMTSTSIGITIFPADSQDADNLLKYADLALYRSKAAGRNNYHFYIAEMDAEVQARKAIERDLRLALGSDQLTMYYQPLIDLHTGAITGSEALIRWFHPQRGFVPPAEFIPIVERTDLIYPLGRWILGHACAQARAWERAGIGASRVAINLSAAQFRHHDLLAVVREVLEETGLTPSRLQLEITESIAMHDVETSIGTLQQLRDIGIGISIDDFGTGYSSLNYLKKLPADKLKIDRSFVTDIGVHPDNAAIVRTIIALGHGIGCKVNVEGVETEEQLAFLRDHHVDEAQGYLFARPLPATEFEALVTGTPWWLADPTAARE